MKNLEKNKNIYVHKGRFYVDCQKDGVRIRRSTGLKKSALAFNYIRQNYEMFLGSRIELEQAQREYYELEDEQVDRRLRKGEESTTPTKNMSEFSFDNVIDKVLQEKSFLKDKTVNFYRTMSNVVSDFLENKNIYYLSDFERHHSVEFVQYCKDRGLKDSSISGYCSFFKMLFRYAINNDLISKNPFFIPRFKQKYEPQETDKFVPFSLDEILTLIRNAGDEELRLFLVVAFFTGARTGEIFALTYADLDFKNRQIRINKTLSDLGVIDSPKTKSSNRVIDMLDIVYKELIKLNNAHKDEQIFKLSRSMIRVKFNNLQEKLGYNKRRLYDTRHSFASVMLSRGEEPMWVGCKMMGHKDLNETYRSYAKYLPKEVKKRATFLNDVVI